VAASAFPGPPKESTAAAKRSAANATYVTFIVSPQFFFA
jgi:hypothetical protein